MIEREFYKKYIQDCWLQAINFGTCCWGMGSIVRTDFLKKNQIFFFEEIKFSEDILFSAKVILCTQKFYYKEEAGIYHYWYNPDSISKSFREGRWESCKKIIEHAEIEFKNRKSIVLSSN